MIKAGGPRGHEPGHAAPGGPKGHATTHGVFLACFDLAQPSPRVPSAQLAIELQVLLGVALLAVLVQGGCVL